MRLLQLFVQARNSDCFDQGKSSGYGKKQVQCGYILGGEPTRFPGKLDLGCENIYQQ